MNVIFQAQQWLSVPLFVSLATQVQSSAPEFSVMQMGYIFTKRKHIGEPALQFVKKGGKEVVKEFSNSLLLCVIFVAHGLSSSKQANRDKNSCNNLIPAIKQIQSYLFILCMYYRHLNPILPFYQNVLNWITVIKEIVIVV